MLGRGTGQRGGGVKICHSWDFGGKLVPFGLKFISMFVSTTVTKIEQQGLRDAPR